MKVFIGKYPKSPNKERTIRVKVDVHDVWNMDHTLSHIIHPMLVKLKEDMKGSPHVDEVDVPEEFRGAIEEDGGVHERWAWVLDQMIWSFGEIKDDVWEEQYYVNGSINVDGYNAHFDKIRNGLRLFGKYYLNLWS